MFNVWMVCIVLLVSASTSSCSWCIEDEPCSSRLLDKTLEVHRVTTNVSTAVDIKCPNVTEQSNASLHKEYSLQSTFLEKIENSSETKERFHVNLNNHTVRYLIPHPQIYDTGLYSVLVKDQGRHRKTQIFLLVEDSFPCPHEENPWAWIMLAVGCGLLALYSLITTMVAGYFVVSSQKPCTKATSQISTIELPG